jgi:hypothetical protein
MGDDEFRQVTARLNAIEAQLRNVGELLKVYDKGRAEMLLILKDLTSAVVKLGGDPPETTRRGNGR